MPESTPAGFCVFSDPESRIFEKPGPESLFISGSSKSLRGLYKCHFLSAKLLNFGCIDGCRSLNMSRIVQFEKISDPDPDSKILEQERRRSLKI